VGYEHLMCRQFDHRRRREMATMTIEASSDTESSIFLASKSTCGCGQALELSHGAHCPRCGIALRD